MGRTLLFNRFSAHQQIRLLGRTLFPDQRFRTIEFKGLTLSLGKNFIVPEHLETELVFANNKVVPKTGEEG